ncbi:MAG: phosphoesterase [Legionellales bacterium]|jgi:intracellular multiplication protein IcmW|nr:phosphoesterase [Legionellales bacterium]
MPDLSYKACQKFWDNYSDKDVYSVTSFMECSEDWTIDTENNEELEASIDELGKTLDKIGKVELKSPISLIEIIAYLKITRLLRVLQAIDSANPGAASKILLKAEELAKTNKSAEVFLHRNVIFERLRLLTRIFDNKRILLIQSAIEGN